MSSMDVLKNYKTKEAKYEIIRERFSILDDFIRGLKQRRATVYTAIMTENIVGFNGAITLSSLLLQANLYCRKNNSLMLLTQIDADKLTEAILSFYSGEYIKMVEYAKLIKSIFECVQ